MKHLRRPEFLLLGLGLAWAILFCGQPLIDAQSGGGFGAILSGSLEVIRLNRALCALFVFGGLALFLLTQNSPVLPKPKMQIALVSLLAVLGLSVALSPYISQGIDNWLNWALAVGAMLLALGAVGRKEGPQIALALILGAGSIVALKGVWEYMAIRDVEPTYRIFAGWSNPNAAAGLFLLLIPVALGLAWNLSTWHRWLAVGSAMLLTSALLLTQSKGGWLAGAIGIAAFFVLVGLWKIDFKKGAPAVLGLLLGAALFGGLVYGPRASGAAAGGGLARITGGGAEAEQSAGFRSLLWKTSIELAKERPYGWGVGSFRFVSGKPGLVTQTVTPHHNYLGLAAEGGILSLIAFGVAAFFWLIRVFPGAKAMTEPQNTLRAGVVAGILGAGAHGMVESTFAYPGFLILFFGLLGIGLQLSADGSAPELMPKPIRQAAVLMICVAPLIAAFWFARAESAKVALLNALATRDQTTVTNALAGIQGLTGFDGEAAYMAGQYSPDPEEKLAGFLNASRKMPSSRVFRALARAQEQSGDTSGALSSLNRALEIDPSNLPALLLMMNMQKEAGDLEAAKEAAQRLIELEKSTVFTVRSLAELVPTETFQARLLLAKLASSQEEKNDLILPAITGWGDYVRLTIPKIKQFSDAGMPYGGQSVETAKENMTMAKEALELYKGDQNGAEDFTRARDAISAASLDLGL